MKQDYRHALMLAFDKEMISLINGDEKCVVLNAVPLPDIDATLKSQLVCEQAFRPEYLALEKAGYAASSYIENQKTKNVIVLAGRNRKVNEQNIIRAWNTCVEGSRIIIAGDKTSGIASLRKWVSDKTEIQDSFSKHHAMVFWFDKSGDDWDGTNLTRIIDGYEITAGMFSSDGPDKGSQLLVEYFDKRIGNRVADFGAGWGYLSAELLKRSERVSSIDLYEADWHSLEAAKHNLSNVETVLNYHWCDITSEYKKHVLDWVIMNPPFHSGRAAEPELGKQFIQTAASTLPSGGRLLMVANRNLPYEQTLEKTFRAFEILEVRNGFKVIEARK